MWWCRLRLDTRLDTSGFGFGLELGPSARPIGTGLELGLHLHGFESRLSAQFPARVLQVSPCASESGDFQGFQSRLYALFMAYPEQINTLAKAAPAS